MEIEKFVAKFAEQFEETPAAVFTTDTKFRDIEEWNSLIALSVIALWIINSIFSSLSVIAMVDDEYGVQLTNDEIRYSNTVADIFEKIKTRKEA